jgi:hypothetical protein
VEDGAVDVRSRPFRPRACGRPACCSASFLRREIKRYPQSARSWRRQTGQLAGTSKNTDRASDLLRRERERVLLSEQEWPSVERERVVSEGEDIDEQ